MYKWQKCKLPTHSYLLQRCPLVQGKLHHSPLTREFNYIRLSPHSDIREVNPVILKLSTNRPPLQATEGPAPTDNPGVTPGHSVQHVFPLLASLLPTKRNNRSPNVFFVLKEPYLIPCNLVRQSILTSMPNLQSAAPKVS